MSDLSDIYTISGAGLQAQNTRMKVIAENIANSANTPSNPKEKPYQRQIITFRNEFDRAEGVNKVKVAGITRDTTPFNKKYDPSHPAADEDGYVQVTNVKPIVETLDMREAQRTYEANLAAIDAARTMMMRTIDLIK